MGFHDELRNALDRKKARCNGDIDAVCRTFDLEQWLEITGMDYPLSVAESTLAKIIEIMRNETPISIPRTPAIEDCQIDLPISPKSVWCTYRRKLENRKWSDEAIAKLGHDCSKILGSLVRMHPDQPSRELVIGRVQSGKTANMAGVIALAVNQGFNFILVLSGTIENLRIQTENRLSSDIAGNGSLNVHRIKLARIDSCKPTELIYQDTQILHVCLKNKKRLENVLRWLKWCHECKIELKTLIIDDEADQAGINTASVDTGMVTKINKAIKDIVHYEPAHSSYLAYTATPYANILNEGPEKDDNRSLYPRHRIHILEPGQGYQGCEFIYGRDPDDDGANEKETSGLVREISKDDLDLIKEIHSNKQDAKLPCELEAAIAWFIYCTAVRRSQRQKSPTSMLVHTSQKQSHHWAMYNAIKKWLSVQTTESILERIQLVWIEISKSNKDIASLPPPQGLDFTFITQVSYGIPVAPDGSKCFHPGIHLCVDNCSSDCRLSYPDDTWKGTTSPAFLVLGGNTLARGLTIEGLVSTYFLRAAGTSDTLMQMGRWFGYRKGYESLPRIWNTKSTIDQFRFLARVEHELRLNITSNHHLNPKDVGPMILTDPEVIAITAANRMQNATTTITYGAKAPQTIHFPKETELLEQNISLTCKLVDSIKHHKRKVRPGKTIFSGVSVDFVCEFIKNFNFEKSHIIFKERENLAKWLAETSNKCQWNDWNIAFTGPKTGDELQQVKALKWTKSNRSAIAEDAALHESRFYIKTLRDPEDLSIDIVTDEDIKSLEDRRKHLENTMNPQPLMLIYAINKDSKSELDLSYQDAIKQKKEKREPNEQNKEIRCNLESPVDLIGLSLVWPGGNHVSESRISITLPKTAVDDGDLSGTENDELLEEKEQ